MSCRGYQVSIPILSCQLTVGFLPQFPLPRLLMMASSGKAACCWTCKIRHVKCDGTPMACLQCTSRQVRCHGYGPKPSWMNGGEHEEQERQRIKRAIKKNFKQKKILQHRQARGQDRDRSPSPPRSVLEEAQFGNSPQIDIGAGTTPSPILTGQSLQSRVLSGRSFPEPLQYDEASLLMHYLDHVFPYQYPFFVKGKWSRGWLLWLLSKNGPLYRASMGLAALHQRSLLGGTESHHLELEFHTKALRQLQDFLASFNINEPQAENDNLVEIITCGIALISFEVLRGSTSNWQPHLCAMASIASAIHEQLQLSQSSEQLSSPLFESQATAAIAFHIPVLLWMDMLACVATEDKPKLPYEEWLGPSCNFELVHIMGCHNSVMRAIGDLGALSEWKTHAIATGNLNLEEFRDRRQRIEDELEDGIEATPTHPLQIRHRTDEGCVTRIFATAALVQLIVVSAEVLPNSSSTRTRRAVSRVALEIEVTRGTVSPRQLSWPICVAGCVADPDQRPLFESLLESVLAEGTSIIGNCGTVLDVLRTCWRYQIEQPDVQWDCGRTMKKMGICALLI
ncbi:fungal-specific transcription factor domain-containing protein [Dactylonectria macrodidyma]|uniref:Fungal-specific transcription factor domain-containing protein n=1 Tax=Dactylonectria macrodidyma TaxID=307937 RepID=A0A9P9FSM3_9HYPO|nr:fungal-specific transcription factor domain-containing protein [Dactylonectria macrodidyma]